VVGTHLLGAEMAEIMQSDALTKETGYIPSNTYSRGGEELDAR
jgi:hypothetical protein